VASIFDFALRVDRQSLFELAARDGGYHFDDAAHLFGEIGGHHVDVVGQVLPRAGQPAGTIISTPVLRDE
jgi:hypothetical protein